MSVPDIATLRQRANTIISRAGSGQMRAMLAGICAAKNTGDPLPADSTGQQLITECQQIIDQADSDALAIFVREFMEFVENAGDSMGCCDQVAEILTIVQRTSLPSEIPPLALGPNPIIGSEGEMYAYQINAYGTLPITFSTISGSIPTGMSLNADTGLITGTTVDPDGGLYNFTVQLENAYGTVSQAYAILVTGAAPSIVSATSSPCESTMWYPTWTWTPTVVTGSVGGYPAVPITYSFTDSPDPLLNATIDEATGVLTINPDPSLVGTAATFPSIRASNYFGHFDTGTAQIAVMASAYWGEWHGALPGSFTEADILTGLFDDTTPGPRIADCTDSYTWLYLPPYLMYPATGVSYARVLAIPAALLTGSYLQGVIPGTWFICDATNTAVPLASLTPAWPTPYQSNLSIGGLLYNIYVITARTAAITVRGSVV